MISEAPIVSNIIELDTRRHHVRELLHCLFCCTQATRRIVPGRRYYDCTGCDEVAAVPYHRAFPT